MNKYNQQASDHSLASDLSQKEAKNTCRVHKLPVTSGSHTWRPSFTLVWVVFYSYTVKTPQAWVAWLYETSTLSEGTKWFFFSFHHIKIKLSAQSMGSEPRQETTTKWGNAPHWFRCTRFASTPLTSFNYISYFWWFSRSEAKVKIAESCTS